MINEISDSLLQTGLLPLAMLIFLLLWLAGEIGFRIGAWSEERRVHPEREVSGIGTVTAGMFALLAFTLGLTISIAQSRYEARREMVVLEANTIGTAWLRAQAFAAAEGAVIASRIEDYAKVRLAYVTTPSVEGEPALIARTNALQQEIWQHLKPLAQREPTPVTASLIAALNAMFDASLSNRFAFDGRTPGHLPLMLLAGAILAIGALGFQIGLSGHRPLMLMALMLAMWTGGLLLIVDLNRPRIGMMRVNPAPLVWTIEGFDAMPKSETFLRNRSRWKKKAELVGRRRQSRTEKGYV